jgi:hypothetical protein
VVSSQDKEVFGVFNLVGEQEANRLETLFASVDVVSEKEVVGLGRESTILEKTQQVVILAMNVTYEISA